MQDTWEIKLIKLLGANEDLDNNSYLSLNLFSGIISHYNLNGETIKAEGYEKGVLMSTLIDKNKTLFSKIPMKSSNDDSGGSGGGSGGSFQRITVKHYTDWYKKYPDGTLEYTHTVLDYITYEYVYVPNYSTYNDTGYNYYSDNSSYSHHSSGYNLTPQPVEEDKIIIDNLTGKAKCIYDQLKQLSLFQETIAKFEHDATYNLIFREGNCTSSDVACTNGARVDIDGTVTITLEDLNYPTLEIAATILHEGIHAEIYRYVSQFENGIDPNNRERLFELYNFYKGRVTSKDPRDYSIAESNAQHVYMAENYVQPIAEAIRALDSNSYPLEYYSLFGWDGLEKYDFNNELTDETLSEYYSNRTTVNNNTNIDCGE